MAKAKHGKKARKPAEGLTGSMGLTADDDVVDSAVGETVRLLRPEAMGGLETFEPDRGGARLAGGGVKRGEALQVAEEEDDFEDGRSSGGRTSRSQEDRWARGDVGSRAEELRAGVLSVEGGTGGAPATSRKAVPPRAARSPEGERGAPGYRPRRSAKAPPRSRKSVRSRTKKARGVRA